MQYDKIKKRAVQFLSITKIVIIEHSEDFSLLFDP
jgi:hypothetical protein